jgi:predicted regulator of Ras-like GTPase activity (Roadblock/LC7/MglB family)
MDWFDRLSANRFVDALMLANSQGNLMRASRAFSSDDELLTSMLQAFEVLAQTITNEFGFGSARMIQLATEEGHILLMPLHDSAYYAAALLRRNSPVNLVMAELERVLSVISYEELRDMDPDRELVAAEATELIEAVEEWLRDHPAEDED